MMRDVLASAWEDFRTAMEAAKETVITSDAYSKGGDVQSQAFKALMELQAMAHNIAVAPNPRRPRIQRGTVFEPQFYPLGQACPDIVYGIIMLDGAGQYELKMSRNDCTMVLFEVHNHVFGHPNWKDLGTRDLAEFEEDEKGAVTIRLCAGASGGNWIALDSDSPMNIVLVRRVTSEWTDDCGTMEIVRVDAGRQTIDLTADFVAERISAAAHFVNYVARYWIVGFYKHFVNLAGGVNKVASLPVSRPKEHEFTGSSRASYAAIPFRLDDGQVAVIELEDVDTQYWSFQVGDVWSRSLDFINYQADLNMSRAYSAPGKTVRIVLSMHDEGIKNWLDTVGRRDGIVLFRSYGGGQDIRPKVRVTDRDLLAREFGEDEFISPSDRGMALAARKEHFSRMFE